MKSILSIGATGSIGREVVKTAASRGLRVRAFVRDETKAREVLPDAAELFVGDATSAADLDAATEGIDAVVLTHAAHSPREALETIDYGIVKTLLEVLKGRKLRIALMTSFGVTAPEQPQNQELGILDLKRRSERLVRRSGHDYTIVRPGWFDYNADDERSIVFLQGDPLRSGRPEAGRIARDEIARVLVDSLLTAEANRKTLELIAEKGSEQDDLTPQFARLLPDDPGAIDGILDPDTLPLTNEPERFRTDLDTV